MLIEVFDRWIIRQKIEHLKDQLAHVEGSATRLALEEQLVAEQKTLQKTFEHEQRAQ